MKTKNNVATHEKVMQLAIWLTANKEKVQAEILSGKTVKELAKEHEVHQETMSKALRVVGVSYKIKGGRKKQDDLLVSALLSVVTRIAREFNIQTPELEAFRK